MKSKNRKILITSTAYNFKSVKGRVKAAGFEPVLFSTIKIIPIDFKLKQVKYDWVIFTSKNAVKYFARKAGKSFFKGINIAAIGNATATLLEKKGLKVTFTPKVFDSERFVDEFKSKFGVKGRSFLVPSSKIAGNVIMDSLKKMGARVSKLTVYDTIMPEISRSKEKSMLEKAPFYFILFSSPSTFKNFIRLKSAVSALKSAGIAVMGRATAAVMKKYGVKPDITGKKQTLAGMIDEIIKYRLSGKNTDWATHKIK